MSGVNLFILNFTTYVLHYTLYTTYILCQLCQIYLNNIVFNSDYEDTEPRFVNLTDYWGHLPYKSGDQHVLIGCVSFGYQCSLPRFWGLL